VRVGLRGVVVCLGLFGILGCERKAPGPAECIGFAELALGRSQQMVMRSAVWQRHFDSLVVACLTTPLNRAAIACTEQERTPASCMQRYDARFWQEHFAERSSRGPFE
jgi:hypothetical protein